MVHNKKTKTGLVKIGVVIILLIILVYAIQHQTVEIIYFINPKCKIVNQTDRLTEEIKNDFQDRVNIRRINVNMYSDDPSDTEEIKELRKKYQIFGVPVIIINGKEFTNEYKKYNLEKEICNSFILRPEVCR